MSLRLWQKVQKVLRQSRINKDTAIQGPHRKRTISLVIVTVLFSQGVTVTGCVRYIAEGSHGLVVATEGVGSDHCPSASFCIRAGLMSSGLALSGVRACAGTASIAAKVAVIKMAL